MEINKDIVKRINTILGSPIVSVELREEMLSDLYEDAQNKFDFYSKLKNKKFEKVKNHWIENYFQANVKETLSHVRGKFGSIPIPGGDITISYKELFLGAQEEKKHLISLFF